METSGFRSDHHHQSHVPQQSRRDKLRVQQALNSTHFGNMSNTLDHQFTLNPDHANLHARNPRHSNHFLFDQQAAVSSEILDFSRNTNGLTYQDLGSAAAGSDVPQSFMIDWTRTGNANAPSFDNWPSFENGNSLARGNSVVEPKYYSEAMNLATPSGTNSQLNYHNNVLHDEAVTVAATRDMLRSESELALLPFSFSNPGNHHQTWTASNNSAGQLGNFETKKSDEDHLSRTIVNDTNLQGLSLSLSSINPQSTLPDAARISAQQASNSDSDKDFPKQAANSKPGRYHGSGLNPANKPSIISKACGKSLQDMIGVSSGAYRSTTGPVGPFTGYATILKSSRFLKPAQQLLDEFCGSKHIMSKRGTVSDAGSERFSGEPSGSISPSACDRAQLDAMDHQLLASVKGNHGNANDNNNSSASSSTFYGSNDINSGDHGGVGSNVSFESGSAQPEQVQQKAKLLYMQEEVSRRYKQYRQQMQMVVSSFESVAGLSSATPYISLALKAVSRHFRCLKSVIAEQLNRTRKALGEDLSTGASSCKGPNDDVTGSVRLKYLEQSWKQKPGSVNGAFSEPQQHHIWRPQRGLPERSVAVLRAWLFEHFLHPYPTDTDKHMLATQTGLTRNQVSNWFINARVRVWKPMVEEIHTLETKGLSADQGNHKHNDIGKIPASNIDHSIKLGSSTMFLKNRQLEPAGMGNYNSAGHIRSELFGGADQREQSQEKRSRLEFQAEAPMSNMAGTVLQGFVPYHRTGLEVWSRPEQ